MPRVQRSVWAGSSTGHWQPRVGSLEKPSPVGYLEGGWEPLRERWRTGWGGGLLSAGDWGRSQGGARGEPEGGWVLNCRKRASGSPRGEVGVRPQGPPCPAVVGWEGQEEQVAGVAGSRGEEGSWGLGWGRRLWGGLLGQVREAAMRGWLERMGSRMPPPHPERLEDALRSRWLGGRLLRRGLRAASQGRRVVSVAPPGGPRTPGRGLRRGLSLLPSSR